MAIIQVIYLPFSSVFGRRKNLISTIALEFKVTLTAPKGSVVLESRHMPTLCSVLEETRRLRRIKGLFHQLRIATFY